MKSLRLVAAGALALASMAAAPLTASAGTVGGLGDGNGDGNADIWATIQTGRYKSASGMKANGLTTFYKGVLTMLPRSGASVAIADSSQSTMGLGSADQVVAVPDLNGDKKADVLARFGSHLYLFKNTGSGTLAQSTEIGHGWASFDNIIYAGSLNGDSSQYLLGRNKDNKALYAYKFTSGGQVTDMGQAGQNWGNIRFMLAPGQISGDSKADLMAIDTKGNMNCYRGVGLGKLANAGVCGTGWNGFQSAFIVGDMDGNGSWDLVGVRKTTRPNPNTCDTQGQCDPIQPLCTNTPASTGYAADYQSVADAKAQTGRTDACENSGYSYRLLPAHRAPMYFYSNKGNAQWGTAKQIGYDMFQYTQYA